MTEKEAAKVIREYREIDDDTGEEYGYVIQDSLGKDGGYFVFRCKIEGVDYNALSDVMSNLPLLGVYEDGTVVSIPT